MVTKKKSPNPDKTMGHNKLGFPECYLTHFTLYLIIQSKFYHLSGQKRIQFNFKCTVLLLKIS